MSGRGPVGDTSVASVLPGSGAIRPSFFTTPRSQVRTGPGGAVVSAGGNLHRVGAVVPRPIVPVRPLPPIVRPIHAPIFARYAPLPYACPRPWPWVRPYYGHCSSWSFGFGFFSSYAPAYPLYQPYPVYIPTAMPVYEPYPVAVPSPVEEFGPPPVDTGVVEAPQAPAEMGEPAPAPEQVPSSDAVQAPPAPAAAARGSGGDAAAAPRMAPEQMQKLMTEGVEAFGKGEYDKAARQFLQVGMADQANVDAWLAYAIARFATGDYGMSATAIRRGIKKAPQVVNAPFDVRERYGNATDFEKHLGTLERYVLENPENADGWVVLGFVRHFSNQRDVAARTFEVVKERYPGDAELANTFLNAKPLETAPATGSAPEPQAPSSPDAEAPAAPAPKADEEVAPATPEAPAESEPHGLSEPDTPVEPSADLGG